MHSVDTVLAAAFILAAMLGASRAESDVPLSDTIYQFSARTTDGDVVKLDKYKGKVVLIVNVASRCSVTDLNYKKLNETYHKYHDKGLEIAVFPCNQFGEHEPGTDEEIKKFILAYGFMPDIYAKIDVNGENAIPLYEFLKEKQGGLVTDVITWNFAKFLVDRQGRPVKRYGPPTDPVDIHHDIEDLL
ncbi:glutathione peroxidase [Aphelenchoides avenae]|nr:glutathione peroxidase [Aphelenchus avenae]